MAAASDMLEESPGPVALEFYSGIGGLRVSLEKAAAASREAGAGDGSTARPASKTASFEINSVANSVSSETRSSLHIQSSARGNGMVG